jgi:hypothetical protein
MEVVMGSEFAIVELMGHRKFGARVTEVERFGAKMLRAEILTPAGEIVQTVHPQAIYAVTDCTEAQARALNAPWVVQSAVPMLPEPGPCIDVEDAGPAPACDDCNGTGHDDCEEMHGCVACSGTGRSR